MGLGNVIKGLSGRITSGDATSTREQVAARTVITAACLHNARAEITFSSSAMSFSAPLVGFDIKEDVFYIDPLMPKIGNTRCQPGETVLSFQVSIEGARHQFRARFLAHENWEGFMALKFEAPTTVTSFQRRSDYRVEPRIIEPVELLFSRKGGILEMPDYILDISATGVSFRSTQNFDDGESLSAIITLPTIEKSMDINLLVIDSRLYNRAQKKTGDILYSVRARFDRITNAQSKTIRQYVLQRQREIIKLNS